MLFAFVLTITLFANTSALLPPFAYTAAQAIMDRLDHDKRELIKSNSSSKNKDDFSMSSSTMEPEVSKETVQNSTPSTASTSTSTQSSEIDPDKSIGVGGIGGLYPALHKYTKCHYNGSIYENGDIVDTTHPCNKCKCHRGQVTCYWQQCTGAPDKTCIPLFVPGNCCPLYSCDKNVT